MEERKNKNKKITALSIFITSILILFISISYAFMDDGVRGTKRQVITTGSLQLDLKEEKNITLANAMPMYDEVGMIGEPFEFTLQNKTSGNINYKLKLKNVTEGSKKLSTSIVKYGLTKDGVVTKDFLSKLKKNVLDSGTIEENQTINYSLRLWIDSNVEDEAQIKDKSLSYKIEVEVSQEIQYTNPAVVSDVFNKDVNLGEICKTYDDGTDTFLVGECSRNYVWYSGKLWRVVLKNNETGTVKMITDNAITVIAYNPLKQPNFENSYVDQWLSQEFLPTLHNYEDYLVVDSVWDTTLDGAKVPAKPNKETTVDRTVGLLNSYEYYTTYGKAGGQVSYMTGYLNNNSYWWLLNPYNDSYGRGTYQSGSLDYYTPAYERGIRPSVNFKSNIHIASGSGTQSDPYRLEGDSQETINGTTSLSTRYSGEYITFNNELYRIVGIEEGKTKIIAVDKPEELANIRFHNANSGTYFERADIKTDLETYYQNSIVEPYKSMIEPNQTWYLGKGGYGMSYKDSICTTVDINMSTSTCSKTTSTTTANVALPRIGEMFTSQITRGARSYFWMLNPSSNGTRIESINSTDNMVADYASKERTARPSMYLKQNVVISKTNTGDGTYEHPYDIELGE